jgi:hypothetical protein
MGLSSKASLRRWVLAVIVKFIELNLPHYAINEGAGKWMREQYIRWCKRRKM